jgi:hypothetical protein
MGKFFSISAALPAGRKLILDLCVLIHFIVYISSLSFHGIGNEAYGIYCYLMVIVWCVIPVSSHFSSRTSDFSLSVINLDSPSLF